MVDQLSGFAYEVTRVAREVGTEGKLGGQAQVPGVSGTWRALTESVNSMADNLTDQVRNIAQVTTAVALGDLSQKITVDARGEILELKQTINKMVEQLSAFASEVTRVAREVGTEGKLGGQAEVEEISGTWRRLTENVNQLASNLTIQVRDIARVATAVTQGDLTRTITIDAPGELGLLKANINTMIANLKETTTRNMEQDWLNSNLARIGAILQGQRDLGTVSMLIMSELTPLIGAQYGAFYMAEDDPDGGLRYRLLAGYGVAHRKGVPTTWKTGEGLVGQAALERRTISVGSVPASGLRVRSSLVDAPPAHVVIFPVLFEEQPLAVVELASFKPFSEINLAFLGQIVESLGVVLNTIVATMRTEELLAQSQSLTAELQAQSGELQRQQSELQHTNAEIELARRELEERAEQLALSSKYKSEFLANISHELRTPLNSLLILAQMLADNPEGNLTGRQVEFANSVHAAGNDLLTLISDILDLSKVEAGKMDVSFAPVAPSGVCEVLAQAFRPLAEQQGLDFLLDVEADLATITTDEHRLQQILKNLLSNACKFTDKGSVTLRAGWDPATNGSFFEVVDTGIGISKGKAPLIFEAFQQADGTTSRRYGGTGLGLSISREIARLLGGDIQVHSRPGKGSKFRLSLPETPPVPDGAPGRRLQGPSTPAWPRPSVDAASHADWSSLKGRHVLIVDDDVRNVYALTSALEDHGMVVSCAHDGRQGLGALRASQGVDVILMDLMMPEMDGYETMKAVRASAGFQDLPIIALTAKAMHGERDKSLAAGASDYVTKPVQVDRLLDTIATWLLRK
ncbi:MAG: ATP-binding protein, partial [Acidimicrobiales bacterium]